MCTSTPTPHPVPSAWYDLSGRLSAASAVSSCALEALPCGCDRWEAINHVGNLIAAIQDLLALAGQDAERLESQLKGA